MEVLNRSLLFNNTYNNVAPVCLQLSMFQYVRFIKLDFLIRLHFQISNIVKWQYSFS